MMIAMWSGTGGVLPQLLCGQSHYIIFGGKNWILFFTISDTLISVC